AIQVTQGRALQRRKRRARSATASRPQSDQRRSDSIPLEKGFLLSGRVYALVNLRHAQNMLAWARGVRRHHHGNFTRIHEIRVCDCLDALWAAQQKCLDALWAAQQKCLELPTASRKRTCDDSASQRRKARRT